MPMSPSNYEVFLFRAILVKGSNISEVVILDARYGYEFNGGHIQNAINISSEVILYGENKIKY